MRSYLRPTSLDFSFARPDVGHLQPLHVYDMTASKKTVYALIKAVFELSNRIPLRPRQIELRRQGHDLIKVRARVSVGRCTLSCAVSHLLCMRFHEIHAALLCPLTCSKARTRSVRRGSFSSLQGLRSTFGEGCSPAKSQKARRMS